MIKFVYFDVGGVLIKDFSGTNKWEQMLIDLGIDEGEWHKFDEIYDEHIHKVHIGKEIDDLLPIISETFSLKLDSSYSLLEDFIIRFEPNETINDALAYSLDNYPTGLLTNMYPRMLDRIFETNLIGNDHNFSQIVDSSIVNAQKPDNRIYEIAKDMAGSNHNEILFIDNSKKNLEVASSLGWTTFLYNHDDYAKSSKELKDFMKTLS